MRRFSHGAALAAALLLSLPLTSPATADTAVAAGTAVGNGTISPGLTMVETFQHVVFTADLVVGGGAVIPDAVIPPDPETITATGCRFEGNSSIGETELVGRGSGAISSCVGAAVAGTINYNRQGAVVTATGDLDINGNDVTVTIVCVFVPTNHDPVTTYSLSCTIAGTS